MVPVIPVNLPVKKGQCPFPRTIITSGLNSDFVEEEEETGAMQILQSKALHQVRRREQRRQAGKRTKTRHD